MSRQTSKQYGWVKVGGMGWLVNKLYVNDTWICIIEYQRAKGNYLSAHRDKVTLGVKWSACVCLCAYRRMHVYVHVCAFVWAAAVSWAVSVIEPSAEVGFWAWLPVTLSPSRAAEQRERASENRSSGSLPSLTPVMRPETVGQEVYVHPHSPTLPLFTLVSNQCQGWIFFKHHFNLFHSFSEVFFRSSIRLKILQLKCAEMNNGLCFGAKSSTESLFSVTVYFLLLCLFIYVCVYICICDWVPGFFNTIANTITEFWFWYQNNVCGTLLLRSIFLPSHFLIYKGTQTYQILYVV